MASGQVHGALQHCSRAAHVRAGVRRPHWRSARRAWPRGAGHLPLAAPGQLPAGLPLAACGAWPCPPGGWRLASLLTPSRPRRLGAPVRACRRRHVTPPAPGSPRCRCTICEVGNLGFRLWWAAILHFLGPTREQPGFQVSSSTSSLPYTRIFHQISMEGF